LRLCRLPARRWQLFPQVFVKGQLIGGLELTKKLIASGEMGQLCR
tara:strand:- start:274 stop:408 length:135 start_codon:yes stop_codon:yes gene_type:complete